LDNFTEKYGLKGSMISAVDLLKGIGKFAGMNVVEVEGATGYIDTNFEGKAAAAINEFKNGQELVYVHVEAPDECGHRGEIKNKARAIELIEEKVLIPILDYFNSPENDEPYKILITPDHATPLPLKTHTHDPVPFLIFNSEKPKKGIEIFNENTVKDGVLIEPGYKIMNKFIIL
jgi:2,3-bisphosphoglycerate-independent phosphoglycerate mutase